MAPTPRQPDRPEERGVAEVVATVSAVITAAPVVAQGVGKLKDKLPKK